MFRWFRNSFEYFFRREQLENDVDEELRTSFNMTVERFEALGMTPSQARRAARDEFGGIEPIKEQVRDKLAGATLSSLLQDVRYAWRGLRRRPSFTAIALLTLALGIGVNAAVFSVFYGVLLHPLRYDHPEELALIWTTFRTAGTSRAPTSPAILQEIEHRNRTLAGVAGIWTVTRTFTGDNPEQVKCAKVTSNFFDLLGVHAARGRTFLKEDSGGPAIMLTDGFFRRRFAGDGSLIGNSLRMDRANRLVGVLAPDFQLHFAPDSNVPPDVQMFDAFGNDIYRDRVDYYIRVVARLKRGVSMRDAQCDLNRVAKEIAGAYTEYASEDLHFTVAGMQADAVRDIQPALAALFAGSAFVLLICCVNVGSLLLARAADRRGEIAMRLSLGASRGRILRQLFAEGGLLCFMGGAAGIGVGWACFRGLLAIRPERLSRIADTGLSWPVMAFAAGCSFLAALLFGIVPALDSFRLDFTENLRAGGRGALGRMHRRAGAGLVIGEITLGFVLVTGAALTSRTLSRIEQVQPGFEPRNRLAFQVSGISLKDVRQWEAQLATLPGVGRVGAISHLPLDRDIPNWYGPFQSEGMTRNQANTNVADLRCVTPGYFSAMGARLLEGRQFDQHDTADGMEVAIVDDYLARITWPGQSAIGKKITAEHMTDQGFVNIPAVVVGVVKHLDNHSLTKPVRGQIYMPFEQSPRGPLTFVLQTRVEPLSLVPEIRRILRARNRNAAMAKVRPMTEYIGREISPVSFTAVLAAIFGGLALLLATTGVYGVFNYQIARRRPEMGIRMALGAHGRDVLGMILREICKLALCGAAMGLLLALLAGRWLGTLLYGVGPFDFLSYSLALICLTAAALIGGWGPARRASASNPAALIRQE